LMKANSVSKEALFGFFDKAGLAQAKNHLVLVDSITPYENVANEHGLTSLSIYVRQYLAARGEQKQQILDRVLAVGVPEGPSFQSYRATSIASYRAHLTKAPGLDVWDFKYPYLDPGIGIEGVMAEAFRSRRWNAKDTAVSPLARETKYVTLDKNGLPTPEKSLFDELFEQKSQDLDEYKKIVHWRLQFMNEMQQLYDRGRQLQARQPD